MRSSSRKAMAQSIMRGAAVSVSLSTIRRRQTGRTAPAIDGVIASLVFILGCRAA